MGILPVMQSVAACIIVFFAPLLFTREYQFSPLRHCMGKTHACSASLKVASDVLSLFAF